MPDLSDFIRGTAPPDAAAFLADQRYQTGRAPSMYTPQAPPSLGDTASFALNATGVAPTLGAVGSALRWPQRMFRAGVGLDPNGSARTDLQNIGVPDTAARWVGSFADTLGDPLMSGAVGTATSGMKSLARSVPAAADAAAPVTQARNITLDTIRPPTPSTPGVTWNPPPNVTSTPVSPMEQAVRGLGQDIKGFLKSEVGNPILETPQNLLRNTSARITHPTGYEDLGAPLSAIDEAKLMGSEARIARQSAEQGGENMGFMTQGSKGPLIFDRGISPATLPHEAAHAQLLQAKADATIPQAMPTPMLRATRSLQTSNIPQARDLSALLNETTARQTEGAGQGIKFLTDLGDAARYRGLDFAGNPTAQMTHKFTSEYIPRTLNTLGQAPPWAWNAIKYGGAGAGAAGSAYMADQ